MYYNKNMFKKKEFNIPTINGISTDQINIHLGLYAGYVIHINKIFDLMNSTKEDYIRAELRRRLSFEYNGAINHEIYFDSISDKSSKLDNSLLEEKIKSYGGVDNVLENILNTAKNTRGVGWVVFGYDKSRDVCILNWVSDHEIGLLSSVVPIVVLDMWEHAYMVDYTPAEKITYVEHYLNALNWKNISTNFENQII